MSRRWFSASALLVAVWGGPLSGWTAPQGSAEEPALRDPFTFGPHAEPASQAQPVLSGILWDATTPMAVLGDEMLGVGDAIAGWRIMEIQPHGIIVVGSRARDVLIRVGEPLPPVSE